MRSRASRARTGALRGRWPALLAVGIGLTMALVLPGTAAFAATPDPLGKVIATIPVGAGPGGVAVDPSGTYAYVANWDNTVSVIDLATKTVTTTISVGAGPFGVAVDPSGTYAYVTNSSDGTVSVIDLATHTVTTTITVGAWPFGVAVDPSGTYAYVTNAGDGTVSVIDLATHTVTTTIPVGAGPEGVAVDPSGTYAYVTNAGDDTVSILAAPPAVTTVSVPGGVVGVSYTAPIQTTGTGPITCAVMAGSLPDGLTLDPATCTVTGTPTTAGDSSFTVRATGPGGSVTKDYTLSVIAPPAVTTVSVPGGVVGVSYTAPIQTTGTGPITCAVTAGFLRPGVALNTNTCTLAGTPTKAGDW